MHVRKITPLYSRKINSIRVTMSTTLLNDNSEDEDYDNSSLNYRRPLCSWNILKRKLIIALLGLTILMFYVLHSLAMQNPEYNRRVRLYSSDIFDNQDNIYLVQNLSKYQKILGYLVSSERCLIPDIDPYQNEATEDFKRLNYIPCSMLKPLTSVVYNAAKKRYKLKIIKRHLKFFTRAKFVKCSYQSVMRNVDSKKPDFTVMLSDSIHFNKAIYLAPTIDSIIVECRAHGKHRVYINGHAMMPERRDIRDRINIWKSKDIENRQNATSVIMIGIDSISRTNLRRAMPKLAQYLQNNEWFEMTGYNKIDDNTYPNLMAILAGLNMTTVEKKCTPAGVEFLDNCSSIIWNTFRDYGYVTAYGEDETWINTFNLRTNGFIHQPVDYYLLPFLMAAEKTLHVKESGNLHRCIGYQDSSDYIFNYAKELAKRFKRDPYFGLFWMSSFSHEKLNEPSAMDDHITDSLKKFMALAALDNTIVFFFSDHGLRFGPHLKTFSGYYEERLPFMFLWLPPQLKQTRPEFINALRLNKNRLTNPYDLHMTLKHELAMSKRVTAQERLAPAEDCPRCQTLFAAVPQNRSCDDIPIEYQWCTCICYEHVKKYTKTIGKLVNRTIDHINHIVKTFRNGTWANLCDSLSLKTIDSAYQAHALEKESDEIYRFSFYTAPNDGLYSATVVHNKINGDFKVSGQIGRLNSYFYDANCISDDPPEKRFCWC